jgi:hypothetical protein
MPQFCRQFPGIRVNLDVGSTNDVIRKISNDEGEIGLVYNPPAEPKLVSRASKRQPMMAIVGPGFPRRSHKVLTVQQLAAYPLAATHPSYGTRQMMEAVEYAERVWLTPSVTTNSFAILNEFVKSGLGIALMPAFAVATELQAKELFAIEIAHPILENAEAHMVTRVGRKLSVAANKMLQMMKGQMQAFRQEPCPGSQPCSCPRREAAADAAGRDRCDPNPGQRDEPADAHAPDRRTAFRRRRLPRCAQFRRKSTTIRLNASACSHCAQCPHRLNTCS